MSASKAARYLSLPCRAVELIAHGDNDVEVIPEISLGPDDLLPWLDGQAPTGQGSSQICRTRLLIFPEVVNSSVPISQGHVKKLVSDLGFPDRFFIDLIVGQRLSAHTTTPTGDCWFMCDPMFSVVTLQKTGNKDILSIIITSGYSSVFQSSELQSLRPPDLEPVMERYISSKTYYRHPLFPILLIADAVLECYQSESERLASASDFDDICHRAFFKHGLLHFPEDPKSILFNINDQMTRLARLSGTLKPFHASLRNLLDGGNVDPGSLQSFSAQTGAQANPIPPLDSMAQYLVSASAAILERITVADTVLQNSLPVMQMCLAERDTEVSLQLARTSAAIAIAAKRDSSSMKVIALLTTLFLPGAFVGTLLSTPEYSNGTPGSWRYWAITVPLTATVMLMLILWMWYTRHVQQKDDDDERKRQDKGDGVAKEQS